MTVTQIDLQATFVLRKKNEPPKVYPPQNTGGDLSRAVERFELSRRTEAVQLPPPSLSK